MKPFTSLIADVQKTRLRGWLVAAVLLLLIIALVSPQQLPVVVYKLSLISLAAVLGYW
ncbi:putative holin, partial [Escherichia coli]